MNHLNKHLEVNHHALEQYLAEQDKKEHLRKKLDVIGLGLMIICGLFGLFYTVNNADAIFSHRQRDNSNQTMPQAGYATAQAPNSGMATTAIATTEKEAKSAPFKVVRVVGNPKTNQRMDFYIDSFHPKAIYEFSFGDGMTQIANQERVSHRYQHTGTYQLQLKVTFEGETQIAFTEKLTIR